MAKIKVKNSEGEDIEVEITQDNLPKELKDDIIKQATGIAYGNIDAKLETLGFQRGQSEKTSDFLERIVKEQSTKIETLEKDQPDTAKYEQTITELKSDLKDLKGQLKNKDGEISAKLLEKEIQSQVKLLSKDMTVPDYLTEEDEIKAFRDTQEQLILNKLTQGYKAKEVDGKIQFLKGDEIVENEDRDVASIQDIVNKDFKFLFKKVEKQSGSPEGGGGSGKPDGQSSPKVSTYEQAVAVVTEKGYMAGSKEFFTELRPILEANGIES